MDKPTKILIGGVALAAFVPVLGKGNSYRIATGLRDLQVACVEEGKRGINPVKAELICEPEDLVSLPITSEPLGGIQAQNAARQRELSESESWPVPAAIAVFIFSCVPWAWYFLLRRIRELRDAIAGSGVKSFVDS